MQAIDPRNIEIETIPLAVAEAKKIQVDILRLDRIHPVISGNKWFKLRYYLDEARNNGKKNIITYGGSWSNHLLATAAACQLEKLSSTGLVRGEKPATPSVVLQRAGELGMHLIFLSREEFLSREYDAGDESYIIPVGGYGEPGVRGAATIADHIPEHHYQYICVAAGTGTTAAGLGRSGNVLAFSVMKNNHDLEREISLLHTGNVTVNHDYHFGGYAKYSKELIHFMNSFYTQTGIMSDFVYTAKMFYGVNELVSKDHFDPGTRLLLIHTGGLIGNASLGKGTLIF